MRRVSKKPQFNVARDNIYQHMSTYLVNVMSGHFPNAPCFPERKIQREMKVVYFSGTFDFRNVLSTSIQISGNAVGLRVCTCNHSEIFDWLPGIEEIIFRFFSK